MAGGPPDLVDCERLAAERAQLERTYELGRLPRLQDLLAERHGVLCAKFGFSRAQSGRSVVRIEIEAAPRLVCQRCMQGYEFPVAVRSEVEIADDVQQDAAAGGEVYASQRGLVSLGELAEEELLLALPLVPACSVPAICGRAPALGELRGRGKGESTSVAAVAPESVRPFAGLQDLLKKHDRK